MNDYLVSTFVEIEPLSRPDFLKVRETLTRIGYAKNNTLYQICFVLHKRGKYYVVHFREMLALDGEKIQLSDEDIEHRNAIVLLLAQWKGLGVKTIRPLPETTKADSIRVIHFDDKPSWNLIPRYTIGKK